MPLTCFHVALCGKEFCRGVKSLDLNTAQRLDYIHSTYADVEGVALDATSDDMDPMGMQELQQLLT